MSAVERAIEARRERDEAVEAAEARYREVLEEAVAEVGASALAEGLGVTRQTLDRWRGRWRRT